MTDGWKLIDSAPKDGTWILIYGDDLGEPSARAAFWGDPAGWYDSEAASRSLTDFGWKPTHWMPLSEPPHA